MNSDHSVANVNDSNFVARRGTRGSMLEEGMGEGVAGGGRGLMESMLKVMKRQTGGKNSAPRPLDPVRTVANSME